MDCHVEAEQDRGVIEVRVIVETNLAGDNHTTLALRINNVQGQLRRLALREVGELTILTSAIKGIPEGTTLSCDLKLPLLLLRGLPALFLARLLLLGLPVNEMVCCLGDPCGLGEGEGEKEGLEGVVSDAESRVLPSREVESRLLEDRRGESAE